MWLISFRLVRSETYMWLISFRLVKLVCELLGIYMQMSCHIQVLYANEQAARISFPFTYNSLISGI